MTTHQYHPTCPLNHLFNLNLGFEYLYFTHDLVEFVDHSCLDLTNYPIKIYHLFYSIDYSSSFVYQVIHLASSLKSIWS